MEKYGQHGKSNVLLNFESKKQVRQVILFTYFVLLSVSARAQRFDDFLITLQEKLPIQTERLRTIVNNYKTKLAHPSWLEMKGLINSDAAASYNGFLNTLILKPNLTTNIDPNNPSSQRLKNWQELRQDEPTIWASHIGVIFHELSHAEYSWMQESKDAADQELVQLLNNDFRDYIKENHPSYNLLDRLIAPSELFSYFREDYIARTLSTIEEIFANNGYYKHRKECRVFSNSIKLFDQNRNLNAMQYILFGGNENFEELNLPTLFVRGKDLQIKPNHPIAARLKAALWKQLKVHFGAATSKSAIIAWMNSGPRLLRLIKPCREQIVQKIADQDIVRIQELGEKLILEHIEQEPH